MRLIFYSRSEDWERFAEHPGEGDAFAVADASGVSDRLGDGVPTYIFMDFDTCEDAGNLASDIKDSYGESCYVIFVSEQIVSPQTPPRGRRRGSTATSLGPLDGDIIDNTLADISCGRGDAGETRTVALDEGAVGAEGFHTEASRGIQAAFDDVLGGTEKTVIPPLPAGPAPPVADGGPPENDDDIDLILEDDAGSVAFDEGGEEEEEEDDDIEFTAKAELPASPVESDETAGGAPAVPEGAGFSPR